MLVIATHGWGPADSGKSSQMTAAGCEALESVVDHPVVDLELEAVDPSAWNSRSEAAWGRSSLGAGFSLQRL